MGTTLLIIFGIVLFLFLVVVHELGHFLVARKCGVEVQEFGIGFPPRVAKFITKAGWVFSINLLPLGGFVRLKGEHDTDTESGSFGSASVLAKAAIMVAGVAMNVIAAYALLTLLGFIGMPQIVDNQATVTSDAIYLERAQKYIAADTIERNSPAAAAGIKPDDAIISIGRTGHTIAITDAHSLPKITKVYAGQTVEVDYRNGYKGPVIRKLVMLRTIKQIQQAATTGKQIGYLGLSVYQAQQGITIVRYTWSAPVVAALLMKQFTILTLQGLGKAVAGLASIVAGGVTGNTHARQLGQAEASSQVSGPVGIFFIFKYGSTLGYRFILFIVAILSLTLAIMNILPIPALDGGRLWLMLVTRAIRKPLSPKREEAINTAGFALLMGLVIVVTVVDVKRYI